MEQFLNELMIELECPYCHARPGEWCITSGGHRATWLHGDRQYVVTQAYAHGYEEGMRWARRRATAS